MRKKLSVDELQFGMYVAELDRPWTETPFLFQGFELKTEEELETLKQYCKKVLVDTEKGLDLSGQTRTKGGAAGAGKTVLASITSRTNYEERASIDAEVPRARAATSRTEVLLRDMVGTIRADKMLDASRVREAVTSMTDSVVRNPDAMLLLARIREKDARNLDRALGVSIYMITFGRFLQLPREQLDLLGMLGLLQDVGMVRLPADLLEKREALTEAEEERWRGHIGDSVAILTATPGLPPELPELAALHHERYDGSGFPKRLKGEEIGLFGVIAGLVDCFDALTHARPYGEALAPSDALSRLYDWRNTLFDGPLVEQFIQCIGIFPVGALVELNSGESGIVIAQNLARRLQPRVMVILDGNGNPLRPHKIIDLAKEPKVDADTPYRIRRTLEKGSVPIDPSEFFL